MTAIRPEFIRLPKGRGQVCPYTGYSRTGLYNLTVPCPANNFRPAVPAKCDRKVGNTRGVWLIPFQRLIDYVNALPTPGMAPNTSPERTTGETEAGQRREATTSR
jgi:hypothetical protein